MHATKEFRGTSPSFVAKLNVSGTDYYYAGIGGLYRRTTGATSWDKVDTSAAGSSKYVATSGVSNGSTLYVTFADPDTKNVIGVFSFNGTTWDRVDVNFPVTGEKLRHVLLANDQLFAVTAIETLENSVVTKTEHKVYYLDGSEFKVSTGGPGPLEIGLPNAIAYDETNYWFSAGTSTLEGPADNLTKETRSVQLGGVIADATGLFFTGRDGRIYEWNDPDWKASAVFEDYNKRPYSFSIPAVVTAGGQTTLLVPSRAYPQGTVRDQGLGYLEFDAASFGTGSAAIADKSRRVSTLNNYFITLDGKSVKQILAFEEGAARRLFALTDGDGLWSNFFDGGTPGSWSGWRRE
jgi:hypothetical protein